jgi:hypothetical protein
LDEAVTPEGRVKAKVNAALKKLGAACHIFKPVQTGFGSVGLDYHLCVRGFAVYIETKKPGGKLTPLQLTTRSTMLRAGAIVLVVKNDNDVAMMTEILSGLGSYDNWYITPQARGLYEEHLRSFEQGAAPDPAARGDHGAPRKASKRRALTDADIEDQVAARIVAWEARATSTRGGVASCGRGVKRTASTATASPRKPRS